MGPWQAMLREWEGGSPKPSQQRAKDPWAHKNGVLGSGESAKDQGPLCGLDSTAPVGSWTKFHPADPSFAPGKYSPLEKEILRLGGVHTAASRRLLAQRQEEERRMLRELQLRSSDFRQVLEFRRQQLPPACAPRGLLEKLWTAQVTVAPEELRVPPRERLDICRHVERMQLARALRLCRPLPAIERARPPGGPGAATGTGAGAARGDGEAEDAAPRQEIKLKVMLKSKEPPKPLALQPQDLKPFFPAKRAERAIAGRTNRSLFRLADFPGDLMLMSQDLLSRGGLHPSGLARAGPRPEPPDFCKMPPGKPPCHQH